VSAPLSWPLDFVLRQPHADVLVVTNMWPEPERPVYGIHVKRQIDSLIAAGVRCDVLYLRGYLSPLAYPLAAAFFLWTSAAWRGRYRLVHAYTAEVALTVRFHLGTPILSTYLGDDILGDRRSDGTISLRALLRARLVRAQSVLLSRTITVSSAMENVLPRRSRARNVVVPQGIDPERFCPLPRREARAALGWREDERIALFAATKPNSPAKRLWLAREACEVAASRIGPIRLEVASGVDPDLVPLMMNAADCLLVTSAVEGSPNAVKEALMCNLPVVATSAGDIEELLMDVTPSWLCAPSAHELASALASCLEQPVRSNGRAHAGGLAEVQIAGRILAVYRELASVATEKLAPPQVGTQQGFE
jgi:glycosyltransferase involved in cell wall biosynthesis